MIIIDNKKPTISNYSKFHSEIKNTEEYEKFADKQIKKYKTEIRSGSLKQALIPIYFIPVEKKMLKSMLINRPAYLLKKEIDRLDLAMDEELFDSQLEKSLYSEDFDGVEFLDFKLKDKEFKKKEAEKYLKSEDKKFEKFEKREISFLEKQSLKLKDDIIKTQLKLKKVENNLKKICGDIIIKNMIDGQF